MSNSRTSAEVVGEARATEVARPLAHAGGEADSLSVELEATVERCAGLVRQAASRHGLSGVEVDEVFQEVRIRLWKSLRSGEKIREVSASYVYRTATTAALDSIRRRRARRESSLAPVVSLDSEGHQERSGPDRELLTKETLGLVRSCVDGLLESRRPVVRMYLNGYKLEEIANVLGWTTHKTRNLLYRGLADLRAALTEAGARGDGGR